MRASLCGSRGKNGGVTQFQALTAALAGSIGTGNIVGVAAAITVGAVSYTHLDVYKRQLIFRAWRLMCRIFFWK